MKSVVSNAVCSNTSARFDWHGYQCAVSIINTLAQVWVGSGRCGTMVLHRSRRNIANDIHVLGFGSCVCQ